MKKSHIKSTVRTAMAAFTLVEMLVVIAIISILMTVGSVGISNIGGKGVSSGVATAEALFDEARNTAVGRNLRAAVLVAKELDDNSADDLRRIIVAYEEDDPATGQAMNPTNPEPMWKLSSRGALLPEQTFFSSKYSKKNHQGGGGGIDEISHSRIKNAKRAVQGKWFIYEFNAQGICKTQGASFIIGSGARTLSKSSTESPPRVTGSAKRDFGGFVVWRNGRTSVFRSPDQMGITGNVSDF